MPTFKMVKYHKKNYPEHIPLNIQEVAGHFDISNIRANMAYSLHTEYSYGKRNFTNSSLNNFESIVSANKSGVPQLWKDELWASDFAKYIIRNTTHLQAPTVIEIHPPFDDYTEDLTQFISRYKVFENIIKDKYPNTEIHIENRCGSIYSGGKFSVSKIDQIIFLCELIEKEKLSLGIALDIPQLYTAHNVTTKSSENITKLLTHLTMVREYIKGVHLWGKNTINGRRIAHHGDLNTYFMNKTELKQEFLHELQNLFNDNKVRNLVLEVNSNDIDINSIISDLNSIDFKYV